MAAVFQSIRPSCSARSNMPCCRRSEIRPDKRTSATTTSRSPTPSWHTRSMHDRFRVRSAGTLPLRSRLNRNGWQRQVAEHKERVQRLRLRVKDFDEVMAKATLPVMPHVERLLLASKKSDRLTLVLGKNQAKLAQLNRMSSEEAAREIGRLEGRLALPPATRTQTKARKPITPLRGSGASPPSGLAAVNAWAKKQGYSDR